MSLPHRLLALIRQAFDELPQGNGWACLGPSLRGTQIGLSLFSK